MQTSNSSARDHVPFSSLELSYSRKPFDSEHNNESKRSSRHAIIEQELTFLTYDLKCFVLYEARNAGHMELFHTNLGYKKGTNNLLTSHFVIGRILWKNCKDFSGYLLFKIRVQVFHQSDSHIFLLVETTVVLFVLISGIPLTVMLRGKRSSCIKLN